MPIHLGPNDPLPFQSLQDVCALEVKTGRGLVYCTAKDRAGQWNEWHIPFAALDRVFPHLLQGARYLRAKGMGDNAMLLHLREWAPALQRGDREPVVFVLGRDAPVLFSDWVRVRKGSDYKLSLEERSGQRWKMRLSDWEAQFPGFQEHYDRCEALGVAEMELADVLKPLLAAPEGKALALPVGDFITS